MENSEIKTEVQSWLLDLPSGASTRIQGWVNEAIRGFERRHNFRCMEAAVTQTTVDQTRLLVAKPALWKEARGFPFYTNQDGSVTEIDWAASLSDMNRTYAAAAPAEGNTAAIDEGAPRYILETEDELHVYPLPDDGSDWDNGLYRMTVPYWTYLADLSADADENFFTVNHPYMVIFGAVELGLRWNRDEERAMLMRAEAEREFQGARSRDKRSRLSDRLTLATSHDVYSRRPRSGYREG